MWRGRTQGSEYESERRAFPVMDAGHLLTQDPSEKRRSVLTQGTSEYVPMLC